jgi:hypothetical protein
VPAYHDFDDDCGDEFHAGFAGPDPYVRQALTRLEASNAAQQQAIASQQQALMAAKREIVSEMLTQLEQEGYTVVRPHDEQDLAAQPTPAARQQRLQFMRRTRARKPVPATASVRPRPYQFSRERAGVYASDPALSRSKAEASYAEIVARVARPKIRN